MWEKEHPTAVVLDDQPLWLEAMGNLLNRLGMEVVGSATAGTDALEVIEENRPDVFVLDVGVGGTGTSDEALACIRSARERIATARALPWGAKRTLRTSKRRSRQGRSCSASSR